MVGGGEEREACKRPSWAGKVHAGFCLGFCLCFMSQAQMSG